MARLIDADALKTKAIRCETFKLYDAPVFLKAVGTKEIDKAPTVDAVPVRHGHWIMNEYDELYCSVCGDIASLDSGEYFYRGKIRFDDSFYCPNCGAKMDEVSE